MIESLGIFTLQSVKHEEFGHIKADITMKTFRVKAGQVGSMQHKSFVPLSMFCLLDRGVCWVNHAELPTVDSIDCLIAYVPSLPPAF